MYRRLDQGEKLLLMLSALFVILPSFSTRMFQDEGLYLNLAYRFGEIVFLRLPLVF